MNENERKRFDELRKQMKKLADEIIYGHQAHFPVAKKKQEFRKLQAEHKKLWLKDQKGKK